MSSPAPHAETVADSSARKPARHGPRVDVLQLVTSFDRGGTERQFVGVTARLLRDTRLSVKIGCIRRGGPFLDDLGLEAQDVAEFPVSGFGAATLHSILDLRRYIQDGGFDVVHAWDFYTGALCAAALALRPRPRLILSRRYQTRSALSHRVAERIFLRMGTNVVFNSRLVAQNACSRGLVSHDRVVVLANGVDVQALAQGVARHCDPRRSKHRERVGMVARMDGDKDHSTLLKAVAELATRRPSLELVLVGDGHRRSQLEREAAQLGLSTRVRFAGMQPDITPWLARFDVGVLASRCESLPNVVLEYMAAGIAVVASDVGGVSEIIRDETEGLVVPAGNHRALARALERLLRDEGLRRALSERGRERARAFSFDEAAGRLADLYLAGSAGPGSELEGSDDSGSRMGLRR